MSDLHDCEDQGTGATDRCTRCRTGFDGNLRPIYPKLELYGVFWCCPECHASYGTNPHANCPAVAVQAPSFVDAAKRSKALVTHTITLPSDPEELDALVNGSIRSKGKEGPWTACHRGACRKRGVCISMEECGSLPPLAQRARDSAQRMRDECEHDVADIIEQLMRIAWL